MKHLSVLNERLNLIRRMRIIIKRLGRHCELTRDSDIFQVLALELNLDSCNFNLNLILFLLLLLFIFLNGYTRKRFKLGKYNQSLEIFLKAESYLDSPDHEIYHHIADLLRMNAKHSRATNLLDAKEYFRRSIMCGKQIHTYKTLANIYRKEKDYIKAIELLESSLGFVFKKNSSIC